MGRTRWKLPHVAKNVYMVVCWWILAQNHRSKSHSDSKSLEDVNKYPVSNDVFTFLQLIVLVDEYT